MAIRNPLTNSILPLYGQPEIYVFFRLLVYSTASITDLFISQSISVEKKIKNPYLQRQESAENLESTDFFCLHLHISMIQRIISMTRSEWVIYKMRILRPMTALYENINYRSAAAQGGQICKRFGIFTSVHVAEGYWAYINPCETRRGFAILKQRARGGIN